MVDTLLKEFNVIHTTIIVIVLQAALDLLGFFRGSVLGQDTSEPQPSTGESLERHE